MKNLLTMMLSLTLTVAHAHQSNDQKTIQQGREIASIESLNIKGNSAPRMQQNGADARCKISVGTSTYPETPQIIDLKNGSFSFEYKNFEGVVTVMYGKIISVSLSNAKNGLLSHVVNNNHGGDDAIENHKGVHLMLQEVMTTDWAEIDCTINYVP